MRWCSRCPASIRCGEKGVILTTDFTALINIEMKIGDLRRDADGHRRLAGRRRAATRKCSSRSRARRLTCCRRNPAPGCSPKSCQALPPSGTDVGGSGRVPVADGQRAWLQRRQRLPDRWHDRAVGHPQLELPLSTTTTTASSRSTPTRPGRSPPRSPTAASAFRSPCATAATSSRATASASTPNGSRTTTVPNCRPPASVHRIRPSASGTPRPRWAGRSCGTSCGSSSPTATTAAIFSSATVFTSRNPAHVTQRPV